MRSYLKRFQPPNHMAKEYQTLGELVEKSGISDALTYKVLEMMDKHPILNKIVSQFYIGINSTSYSKNHIAAWDNKGRLRYFHPDPHYPEDFVMIDHEKFEPIRYTDEEILSAFPSEFAAKVAQIFTCDECEEQYTCDNHEESTSEDDKQYPQDEKRQVGVPTEFARRMSEIYKK
jgi:hypothetical protein